MAVGDPPGARRIETALSNNDSSAKGSVPGSFVSRGPANGSQNVDQVLYVFFHHISVQKNPTNSDIYVHYGIRTVKLDYDCILSFKGGSLLLGCRMFLVRLRAQSIILDQIWKHDAMRQQPKVASWCALMIVYLFMNIHEKIS